jgi:hypothetical protein
VFSYWAFYIHRNDLLYQLNLERNLVLFFLIAVFLALLIRIVRSCYRWHPVARIPPVRPKAA